ncbi:YdeI/OmpD-associated family protein [Rudanella paleaurantiibacter]|uniref:YdeI/OmpD-associated family protein n=1 Tax=Rudanella paleaurantiibacter TaxID=2614655 RepID=UPI00162551CE|nr:YdeI/OmpD-associated family protein [Rudanella paleaurantiibacter]
MLTFTALLEKFGAKGEKTGWTYFSIPLDVSEALRPGQKTSFRVKGQLDALPLKAVALIPMGDGTFILPVNTNMRRQIRKEAGASVQVQLAFDDDPQLESADLLACLEDDPQALAFFQTLPRGHQNYFSRWIESAKTPETKATRIARTIHGLSMRMGYNEMVRYYKSRE